MQNTLNRYYREFVFEPLILQSVGPSFVSGRELSKQLATYIISVDREFRTTCTKYHFLLFAAHRSSSSYADFLGRNNNSMIFHSVRVFVGRPSSRFEFTDANVVRITVPEFMGCRGVPTSVWVKPYKNFEMYWSKNAK